MPVVVDVLRSHALGILGGELWLVRDGFTDWVGAIPQQHGPPGVYVWETKREPGEPWPNFIERGAFDVAQARRYLEARAREARFTLVRRDDYLSPNDARNLGFACVDTPYVAFVDNNAVVGDGWLDDLLECARTTSAAFVSPVYCEGSLEAVKSIGAHAIARGHHCSALGS